jgi:virginiamycin A acetyltransferase
MRSVIKNGGFLMDLYEVTDSMLGEHVVIGDYTKVLNSRLEDNVQLDRFNHIVYSSIGKYSYTGHNVTIKGAEVGKFNSISWNVSIGGNNHDMDKITTHSFLVYPKFNLGGDSNWKSRHEPCIVGNDVWIGTGAVILRGVHVGNGAIIGASSVVTKDVPPYAIVAGNPARIIRMRLEDTMVERLLELKWWDFDDEVIRQNFDLFNTALDNKVIDKMFEIKNKIDCPEKSFP